MAFDKSKAAALIRSLKKRSGKTYHCCGLPIEVDHFKAGCTGRAENYGEPIDQPTSHSGEVHMTDKQLKDYMAKHGRPKKMRPDGRGGFYVEQK